MRTIDADKLKNKVKEISSYCSDKLPTQGILQLINQSPTVDPESLRQKGEWTVIDGEGWNEDVIYQCSICKEEFVTIDGTPAENLWNYCPNCGAKMEG